MLRTLHLPEKLRRSLVKSGITGEISSHGAKTNIESINRLIKLDPYVTFGISVVIDAVKQGRLNQEGVTSMMAEALGIPVERFRQPGPGYIDPQLTATKLTFMLDRIDEAIAGKSIFLLATAHPGSLMSYYAKLKKYIVSKGGSVYESPDPYKVGDYRWLDVVGGVHVLSDQGNLMHTHDGQAFAGFLASLPSRPTLALADHGYAGAAINSRLKTVAIHDVDDPGIAVAEQLGADVLTIPMNDNQLNVPTALALEALLNARR